MKLTEAALPSHLSKLMVLLNPVPGNLAVVDKTHQGEPLPRTSFNRANLVIARGCVQLRAPENFVSFTGQTKVSVEIEFSLSIEV